MAAAYHRNATALGRTLPPLSGPPRPGGSTDMGNVSLAVPSIHPMIGIDSLPASNHQPEFAAHCVTEAADKALVDGALAMAWTAIDLATDATLRAGYWANVAFQDEGFMTAKRLIITVCTAQVLAQIGAYSLAALLPLIMQAWSLSNAEAGWMMSVFYGGYTLSVPVLVSLTDRVDPRRVYCAGVALLCVSHLAFALAADQFWWGMGCRAIAGIGWAGTTCRALRC